MALPYEDVNNIAVQEASLGVAAWLCAVDEGMDSEDAEEDNGAMVEVDPTTGELLSFNGAAAGDSKAAAVGGDGACEEAPARSFLRMRGGGSFNRDGAWRRGRGAVLCPALAS